MKNGLAIPLLMLALTFVYYLEKEPEPVPEVRVVVNAEPTIFEKSWIELKEAVVEALTQNLIDMDKALFGDLFDEKNLSRLRETPEKP